MIGLLVAGYLCAWAGGGSACAGAKSSGGPVQNGALGPTTILYFPSGKLASIPIVIDPSAPDLNIASLSAFKGSCGSLSRGRLFAISEIPQGPPPTAIVSGIFAHGNMFGGGGFRGATPVVGSTIHFAEKRNPQIWSAKKYASGDPLSYSTSTELGGVSSSSFKNSASEALRGNVCFNTLSRNVCSLSSASFCRAVASAIFIDASRVTTSEILYPIIAEENAENIPTAPNTAAAAVTQKKIASQVIIDQPNHIRSLLVVFAVSSFLVFTSATAFVVFMYRRWRRRTLVPTPFKT